MSTAVSLGSRGDDQSTPAWMVWTDLTKRSDRRGVEMDRVDLACQNVDMATVLDDRAIHFPAGLVSPTERISITKWFTQHIQNQVFSVLSKYSVEVWSSRSRSTRIRSRRRSTLVVGRSLASRYDDMAEASAEGASFPWLRFATWRLDGSVRRVSVADSTREPLQSVATIGRQGPEPRPVCVQCPWKLRA